VPAAPRERQLVAGSLPAGAYDAIRIGQDTSSVSLSVAQNQAEPVLLGIDEGRLIPGSAYAGNDQANLGLGELSGKFVPMPAFGLVDQGGARLGLDTIAGHDVVIAAFHTSCHETCPLYTALFLQLARQVPPGTMLLEVTTDPATDSPAVLAGYAAQVAANWTFATGTQQQLAEFWKPFKVDLAAGDTHASTLALVDRHGYIRLVYRGVPKVGNEIPPSLVTSLSALGLQELATGGDGWGAPDLLQALTTISGPAPAAASRGGQARDFTLTSTEGAKVSLSDFAGTPLVLNFWATYCPPCRAEMPMLQQAMSSQPRARLILVDEGDGRDSARAFLQSQGIHGAALLDSDGSVLRSYGLSALPTTIFIRSDGTVDRRQVGQLDPSVLAAEVSSLTSQ
jgi:cytochrome oxidase Cu insertion factor (SCO1/SenC/PrrC family)